MVWHADAARIEPRTASPHARRRDGRARAALLPRRVFAHRPPVRCRAGAADLGAGATEHAPGRRARSRGKREPAPAERARRRRGRARRGARGRCGTDDAQLRAHSRRQSRFSSRAAVGRELHDQHESSRALSAVLSRRDRQGAHDSWRAGCRRGERRSFPGNGRARGVSAPRTRCSARRGRAQCANAQHQRRLLQNRRCAAPRRTRVSPAGARRYAVGRRGKPGVREAVLSGSERHWPVLAVGQSAAGRDHRHRRGHSSGGNRRTGQADDLSR